MTHLESTCPTNSVSHHESTLSSISASPISPNPQLLTPVDDHACSLHPNTPNSNSVLTTCAVRLIRFLYPHREMPDLTRFIVLFLRRSKTLFTLLQLACYYLAILIRPSSEAPITDEKKLFLGLVMVASKFNQDHNLPLKAWLKICGTTCDEASIKGLRTVERECLKLLNYACSLNGPQHTMWCNVLAAFGHDLSAFSTQKLSDSEYTVQLEKWHAFFERFHKGQASFHLGSVQLHRAAITALVLDMVVPKHQAGVTPSIKHQIIRAHGTRKRLSDFEVRSKRLRVM